MVISCQAFEKSFLINERIFFQLIFSTFSIVCRLLCASSLLYLLHFISYEVPVKQAWFSFRPVDRKVLDTVIKIVTVDSIIDKPS